MNRRTIGGIAFGLPTILVLAVLLANVLKVTASPGQQATEPRSPDMEGIEPPVDIPGTDFLDTLFILSPALRPELMLPCVNNRYFPLIPGTVYHYRAETEEGVEEITFAITNEKKEILGIQAFVIRDTVLLDGELKEDTFDWFAQDERGNVWYLGEDTKEYEDGEVVSTAGSWEAGVDGAVAGIIMEGRPRAGDVYREEYYAGEAEDIAAVLSRTEAVTVPFGSFRRVLQTANSTPLDPVLEHKFYAPGVGEVKEVLVESGESAELVSISHDPSQIDLTEMRGTCGDDRGVSFIGTIYAAGKRGDLTKLAKITRAQARNAVLALKPQAKIQGIELTIEQGFLVYEVTLRSGHEYIVDAGDGVVLSVDSDSGDDRDGQESGGLESGSGDLLEAAPESEIEP